MRKYRIGIIVERDRIGIVVGVERYISLFFHVEELRGDGKWGMGMG